MKSKHTAIYRRVSTRRQDTASQDAELRQWAAQQSGAVVWYDDSATGKNMDRPGWQRLEAAILRGEVTLLACWRIDRLGRTVRGLSKLFETLQTNGVNLKSLRDGVDLSTPAGRLVANVMASAAQYELEVITERIRAGQAAARAEGKRIGGGKPGRLIKVTREQIDLVRRLDSESISKAAIARATGLSRPTIYRLLQTANAAK